MSFSCFATLPSFLTLTCDKSPTGSDFTECYLSRQPLTSWLKKNEWPKLYGKYSYWTINWQFNYDNHNRGIIDTPSSDNVSNANENDVQHMNIFEFCTSLPQQYIYFLWKSTLTLFVHVYAFFSIYLFCLFFIIQLLLSNLYCPDVIQLSDVHCILC